MRVQAFLVAAAAVAAGLQLDPPRKLDRRGALSGAVAALGAAMPPVAALAASLEPTSPGVSEPASGRYFPEVILPPVRGRATVRTAMGRGPDGDGMWSFEQLLVFTNVSATIRMTVVRLADGKLWVHAPVAPTGECLALLSEIGGEVAHIVLPVTALEHKAFFGPFARAFPDAQTWVAPGQYGPFGELTRASDEVADGWKSTLPYRVDGVLGDVASPTPPWAAELEYKVFYADIEGNAGPVSEVAFYHRPSTTLIVTDAVVFVPPTPPALFETVFGEEQVRKPEFWPKSVLQAVFLPLRQDEATGEWPGYERIKGRLLRAPILRAFGDVRAPELTREWVDSICDGRWKFDRIISAHFASPIGSTSPKEFKEAFGRLYGADKGLALDPRDWSTLDGLNDFIETNKLGAPLLEDYR